MTYSGLSILNLWKTKWLAHLSMLSVFSILYIYHIFKEKFAGMAEDALSTDGMIHKLAGFKHICDVGEKRSVIVWSSS